MPLSIRKVSHLTAHTGSVYAIQKNPFQADSFFTAGGDGKVLKWNFENLDTAYLTAKVETNIFSLCPMVPEYLLLGQMQGGIHVLGVNEKKEIRNIIFHSKGIFDIVSAENNNVFFVAGGDGVLSLWSNRNFDLLKSCKISENSIRSIIIDEENQTIYAGCSDSNIYVLNYKTLEIIHQFEAHKNSIFSLCLSPDGKFLLSGSRDAHLNVWKVEENYSLLHSQPAHLFTINHIVFHPQGKWFATAGRDKHIKIWNAKDFSLLKVIDKEKFDGHVNSVNSLWWSDYNNYLVSCSDDRSIIVWEIK
jgi:WD40 repeat protein